jgi:hypothetical protein
VRANLSKLIKMTINPKRNPSGNPKSKANQDPQRIHDAFGERTSAL